MKFRDALLVWVAVAGLATASHGIERSGASTPNKSTVDAVAKQKKEIQDTVRNSQATKAVEEAKEIDIKAPSEDSPMKKGAADYAQGKARARQCEEECKKSSSSFPDIPSPTSDCDSWMKKVGENAKKSAGAEPETKEECEARKAAAKAEQEKKKKEQLAACVKECLNRKTP